MRNPFSLTTLFSEHCILLRLKVLFLSVPPILVVVSAFLSYCFAKYKYVFQSGFIDTFLLSYTAPNTPIPANIAPNTTINKIKSINDRTSPAIASPLGFLNTPAKDIPKP